MGKTKTDYKNKGTGYKNKGKTFNVYVGDELYNAVKKVSEEHDLSLGHIVRVSVAKYLEEKFGVIASPSTKK